MKAKVGWILGVVFCFVGYGSGEVVRSVDNL